MILQLRGGLCSRTCECRHAPAGGLIAPCHEVELAILELATAWAICELIPTLGVEGCVLAKLGQVSNVFVDGAFWEG